MKLKSKQELVNIKSVTSWCPALVLKVLA